MRKKIKILLKSDAPLAISDGFKGEWSIPTKKSISGSTARGALANYLIQSVGLPKMKELLLAPGTSVLDFHPMRPGISGNEPEQAQTEILDQQVARIIETGKLPQTVVSCKRRHGFLGESYSDGLQKHGLTDSLDVLLLNLLNTKKGAKGFQTPTLQCHKCYERLKEFEGWYQLEKRKNEDKKKSLALKGMSPTISSYVHVGINPDFGTAAQEIFYTIDALDEAQYFLGTILVDDAAEEWLKILQRREYLFLGGGKSRGYGAGKIEIVQLEAEKKEADPLIQSPDERCQTFTARMREKGALIADNCWLVPLTLLAPAILMDQFLRPVVDDITRDVRNHGLPTTEGPILVKGRMQIIQGWHSVANVPKPDFPAIAEGSVFVYQCPVNNQTVDALRRIEEMGIGFRRAEGFGRVRVASPLHTEEIFSNGEDD